MSGVPNCGIAEKSLTPKPTIGRSNLLAKSSTATSEVEALKAGIAETQTPSSLRFKVDDAEMDLKPRTLRGEVRHREHLDNLAGFAMRSERKWTPQGCGLRRTK
jgi:hypothetical protein